MCYTLLKSIKEKKFKLIYKVLVTMFSSIICMNLIFNYKENTKIAMMA